MTNVAVEVAAKSFPTTICYGSVESPGHTVTPALQFIREHVKENPHMTEESFYVTDVGTIKQKIFQWKRELPRVRAHYAVKCNPNDKITDLLRTNGIGFDCASLREMKQMLDAGTRPKDIIFANPCKMPSHIRFAREHGVTKMTFDNKEELEKISAHFPDAELILRILTDDSRSVCRFGAKFGAPEEHVPVLLTHSVELGLNIVGVSFHVGSGCLSADSFVEAVERAHKTFQIAERLGINMHLLDIGGGFPGFDGVGPTFQEIAGALRCTLDSLFPEDTGVQLIAEPGRYFVAQSHTLATCIYARRDIFLDNEAEDFADTSAPSLSHLYYTSDGVYSSFNCLFFDHAEVVPKVVHPRDGKLYKATIFGPTCDSLDCIAKNVLLPKLEVGDWLYFENMGAYTISAASEFNGFSKAHMLYIDSSAGV